jgi:hypothetical protein
MNLNEAIEVIKEEDAELLQRLAHEKMSENNNENKTV